MLRRFPVGWLLGDTRKAVWAAARAHGVRFGSATRLSFPDGSADVIYACHMLEHLSRAASARFFHECRRVLAPGGILRIVVPDLALAVGAYDHDGDADALVERLMLADERRGIGKVIRFNGHRWMYDGESLRRRLEETGFRDVSVLPAGETTIDDPGELNLREREEDSVYVEARR
jgi:predicted SAM-dependent methyltransferase